ncbi:DUF2612 domain-containing protein [Yersinia ruckeri]|uniref:DUF2612 domain-containing protein n=1 Tax=Yersinia ruckeri TaxID=29486 RepID=UPI0008FD59F6|nr:DUF2612 domain-containing protein [Yersinia ruckeri]MCW6525273.1 DUF2612 domain-containing protein [Yersinia ruckeri]MCW6592941.1 DUF2612 domain-containing protein [Yersinia ruckeri]MCW6605893.1 DUF2612 domain-containing protein [Yersinia ruckeri]OIX43821.1 hypothetical protein AXW22_17180 [Yersinia ruckeri]OJC86752.1 hypothetical protein AXW45_17755 [Yersinia ruckeri]
MSWKDTVLTQYSASEKLLSIIDTFNQAVNLDEFTDEFINEVWNVNTCGSFGLDVWGKIVNVSRYIKASIDTNSFGFSEANDGGSYPSPFNEEPFYAGVQETETVRLSDDAYRTLILCKAFSNISIATIKEINKFLSILFKGRGRAFCVDYGDMRMGVICEFYLAPYEVSILENYEVLPIPSAVLITTHQIVPPYFGFSSDAYPFNDGTFFREI